MPFADTSHDETTLSHINMICKRIRNGMLTAGFYNLAANGPDPPKCLAIGTLRHWDLGTLGPGAPWHCVLEASGTWGLEAPKP